MLSIFPHCQNFFRALVIQVLLQFFRALVIQALLQFFRVFFPGQTQKRSHGESHPQKRTLIRGAAKPALKKGKGLDRKVSSQIVESSCIDSVEPENSESECEDSPNKHPMVQDSFMDHYQDCPQGILWLTSYPSPNEIPPVVSIPSAVMQKNMDDVKAFYRYIVSNAVNAHPELFTQAVLSNWELWYHKQLEIWGDTPTYLEQLATISPFRWISSYQTRLTDTVLPPIPSSERPEPLPGTEIILHNSGKFGHFSASERVQGVRQRILDENTILGDEVIAGQACIYRWFDSEDGKHYVWVAIVHSVEGDPVSPDCNLVVRWCPNDKKRNFRNRISEEDSFDTKYTQMRGPTKKYVMTIEKSSCLAFNLQLTGGGKFDSRTRTDGHFGSTSKEVAATVLKEFYEEYHPK